MAAVSQELKITGSRKVRDVWRQHEPDMLSYGFDPFPEMNWPLEWTVTYGQGRIV